MFREYLLNKYLEWQAKAGSRKSVVEFADYLGYPQPTVSAWMNGTRAPNDEGVILRLAVKTGIGVYDALGRDRPDEALFYIIQHWGDLTEELRAEFLEKAEANVERNGPKEHKPAKSATRSVR